MALDGVLELDSESKLARQQHEDVPAIRYAYQ
jgi:hypothetical protein